MTTKEINNLKSGPENTYKRNARLSGLSVNTETENAPEEAEAEYGPETAQINFLSESGTPYMAGSSAKKISSGKQGEYTVDDYYALPDERRAELIDGVIYDMASPTFAHQMIADKINICFSNFIEEHNGSCISVTAPLDVQLDQSDKTMVQPDVMVICDRSKIKKNVVYGAPDLVAEVLSPSTYKKDMRLKLKKYSEAGVREYWIIDPDDHAVTVYKFEDVISFKIYEEDETAVPAGIFGDKCVVDFKEIFNMVSEIENEQEI